MTVNELIEKAHSQAKDKGFWDQERNTGELLMLIISECCEALEAHRSGKRADMQNFVAFRPTMVSESDAFRSYIKDTFEDELADIVIRIADLCGAKGADLTGYQAIDVSRKDGEGPFNVGDILLHITRLTCELEHPIANMDIEGFFKSREPLAMSFHRIILHVFNLAREQHIDLWRHVELKLAYNATRPRLHGKSY